MQVGNPAQGWWWVARCWACQVKSELRERHRAWTFDGGLPTSANGFGHSSMSRIHQGGRAELLSGMIFPSSLWGREISSGTLPTWQTRACAMHTRKETAYSPQWTRRNGPSQVAFSTSSWLCVRSLRWQCLRGRQGRKESDLDNLLDSNRHTLSRNVNVFWASLSGVVYNLHRRTTPSKLPWG